MGPRFLLQNNKKSIFLKTPQNNLVCTISSGQDSIFLLFVFLHIKKHTFSKITIVYCHHFWQVQNFQAIWQIWKLAVIFELPFYILFSNKILPNEQRAKKWRYQCFGRVSILENTKKIALGHTFQDTIETGLWHFVRGTSPSNFIRFKKQDNFFKSNLHLYFPKVTNSKKKIKFPKNKVFYSNKKKAFPTPAFRKFHLSKTQLSNSLKLTLLKDFNQYLELLLFRTSNNFFLSSESRLDFEIWRPLKNVPRQSITKFCLEHSLPILPDPTNEYLNWPRNRIRNYLLPILRYFFNKNIDKKVFQFSKLLNDQSQILENKSTKILYSLFKTQDSNNKFKQLPFAIQRLILFQLLEIINPGSSDFIAINRLLEDINHTILSRPFKD